MTGRIFASALFAGLAAGVLAALLQLWLIVPLILEAEIYESPAHSHETAAPAAGGDENEPDHAASDSSTAFWDDPGRHVATLGMTVITYTAFGLVLVAAMALAARRGHVIDGRRGLVWGLAGFVAVHLAPGLGLPPELPGTVSAELEVRQMWWAGTVAAAAVGIACLAFGKSAPVIALGVALLALPHVIGAPHADGYFSIAPAELAAQYAATAYAVGAAGWALLGGVAGYLWSRGG